MSPLNAAEASETGKGRLSPVAPAALLIAEIERLKAELGRAEVRIAELEARAEIDPLVDLFNRRGFERELSRGLAYVRRYGTTIAMLYIDLDGFKPVNDRFGHATGDMLLAAVARALRSHVRASDVVARLGGDEFAVLLWNATPDQAGAKARQLEDVIGQIAIPDAEGVAVGASIGTAMLSGDAMITSVIDAADRAMYARKKARRG